MSSIKSIGTPSKLKEFIKLHGLIETGSSLDITPLTGGFWNAVYRVTTNSQDWIVKCMQASNDGYRLYPNLPRHEVKALQLVSELDIAPKLLAYYSADEHYPEVLIYNFVKGTMLTKQLNATDKKPFLHKAAALFAKQHAVKFDSKEFRHLPQDPKGMIALAENFLTDPDIDLSESKNAERLHTFQLGLKNNPKMVAEKSVAKPVFLHSDAWAGNFVFDAETQKLNLIDWQCPAIGDASFDLWTFAYSGFNFLVGESVYSSEEIDCFIEKYSLLSGDATIQERLAYFGPYYSYQIAAHCCQRIVALAGENPQASLAYQQVLDHHFDVLEQGEL